MKIVLICLILVSSYMFGVYVSKKYLRRTAQLENAVRKITELSDYISVRKAELDKAVQKVFGMENIDYLMKELNEKRMYPDINEEERSILTDFFEECGKSEDRFEALKAESCTKALKRMNESAREECNSKGKVYKTVSFCVGMAVSIIIL